MADFSSEHARASTDAMVVGDSSTTTSANQKVPGLSPSTSKDTSTSILPIIPSPDERDFTGRTLVLCFDGTGDQFDRDNSNVVEFTSLLKKGDRPKQLVYYQAGIGTDTVPHIATPPAPKTLRTLYSEVLENLPFSLAHIPLSEVRRKLPVDENQKDGKRNVTAWDRAQIPEIPVPVPTKRRRAARHLRHSPYAVQWRFDATPVTSENSRKARKKVRTLTALASSSSNAKAPASSSFNAKAPASLSNANIRPSKSPINEERERIKEFWFALSAEERQILFQIEKDTLLRKTKEQQKDSGFCSCAVCSRKHGAMEKELEVLYDAYYEELEQYANYQQRYISSGGTIPPPPGPGPLPGSVELDAVHPTLPRHQTNSNSSSRGPFNLSSSSDVFSLGSILTVADDLLKNDGQKFLKMIEQLVERRMAREKGTDDVDSDSESKAEDSDSEEADSKAEEDNEEDGETDEEYEETEEDKEDSILMEEQKMVEDERVFSIFAARMFEQRVFKAYREQLAQERQLQLLKELEEEDKLKVEKQRQREKKKERRKAKKRQKQAKESSKALVFLEGESQQSPDKHDTTPNDDDDDDTKTLVDDSGNGENSSETIDDLLNQPANSPFVHEDVTKPESPNSSQLPSHSVFQPGSSLAPTGNPNSLGIRIKNTVAAVTVLRSLESAALDSDFELIRDKLVKEWWLTAPLILAIFAVDTAAYALSPDSFFQVTQSGELAIAGSGLTIAMAAPYNAYLIIRFSKLDGGRFKTAATDVYDSFVCFSILFSLPLFLVAVSSLFLSVLLIEVAYNRSPLMTEVWLGIIGSIYLLPYILRALRMVTRLLRRIYHALFDVFGLISDFVVALASYLLDRLTGVLRKLGLR